MAKREAGGAPPDAAALREAAVAHLGRYAATASGLTRVLDRRIERWATQARALPDADAERVAAAAAVARAEARAVVARLVEIRAVDDAAFAVARARRLLRSGRSRVAVAAHLAARGVQGAVVQAALPEDPRAELAAAVAFARRRRLGPFAPDAGGQDGPGFAKALAALARAGFAQGVAQDALRMDPTEAEAMVLALRQG